MKPQTEAGGSWMNVRSSMKIKTNVFSKVFHPCLPLDFMLNTCEAVRNSTNPAQGALGCVSSHTFVVSVATHSFRQTLHRPIRLDPCSQLHRCSSAPHCKAPPCRNPHLSHSTPWSWPEKLLHVANLPLHLDYLIFKNYLLFEKSLPLLVLST